MGIPCFFFLIGKLEIDRTSVFLVGESQNLHLGRTKARPISGLNKTFSINFISVGLESFIWNTICIVESLVSVNFMV